MTKVTVSLTRKVSVEMHDGRWESVEAACAIEDEVPQGTDRDSFAAGLRVYVKAVVDDTMTAHKKELMSGGDIGLLEELVTEVGAIVGQAEGEKIDRQIMEEPPPLPTEAVEQMREVSEKLETTEVRTPLPPGHKSFIITHIEVAESEYGKYLKVYGYPNKSKPWVPAWNDAAQDLFDNMDGFSAGDTFPPPYPLEAVVEMGEYKGKPSPKSVVEWVRIE